MILENEHRAESPPQPTVITLAIPNYPDHRNCGSLESEAAAWTADQFSRKRLWVWIMSTARWFKAVNPRTYGAASDSLRVITFPPLKHCAYPNTTRWHAYTCTYMNSLLFRSFRSHTPFHSQLSLNHERHKFKMLTLSGQLVNHTLKHVNKHVKGVTDGTDPRWFTNLDHTVLGAPGYLAFGFVVLEIRVCVPGKRWNFLEAHVSVSRTVSKQID